MNWSQPLHVFYNATYRFIFFPFEFSRKSLNWTSSIYSLKLYVRFCCPLNFHQAYWKTRTDASTENPSTQDAKEDPINEDPKEDPITEDLEDSINEELRGDPINEDPKKDIINEDPIAKDPKVDPIIEGPKDNKLIFEPHVRSLRK